MTAKEQKGKEILKEALGDYELSFDEKYPPEEMDVVFSKKYQKMMNRMLSGKQKNHSEFLNTSWKRVAAFIVAFAMVLGCSMTVKAFREPVVGFFTNIYEKIIEIFFDDDDIAKAPSEIETVYTLGYVPEGYEMEVYYINEYRNFSRIVFSNEENEIELSQYTLDSKTGLDNENANYKCIYIDDMKVAMIEKYTQRCLYWNTDEYAFSLIVDTKVSEDECIAIIQSISEKNN